MILVQILIPLSDNQDRRFTAADFDAWEGELVRLFGGFSRLPGAIAGGWEHDGVIYRDQSAVYEVALDSLVSGDRVGQAAAFARAHFEQLAILVKYLGRAEVLS